ncbi:Ti-type conjugative transfer relaxase TraA [Mesorhizobium sp. B2-5-13]|uniref:Ti-type conjugative transfer relaxase TraA n=1 Tax=unclassified Mesorhizobium TaxID=325217 RepID=UPI00112890AC|nr:MULTISPECIES: Ti-type conjugative transfer relaxase TraA [unclassified Mesorhizobium]TPJ81909.1 Ti-type conjugative transfer relaxase TraA [Mesorhizobium sp. B2-5-13]TPK45846.1 Ti-type conjugative transfer relaxase TraA [Mesorhizobium sp. B2-5-5]
MAITHFTPQLISRSGGRSAVLSAAYRHCARMEHEAEARTVDYSNKRNLAHEEFLLPPDAPAWARALIAERSVAGAVEAFWNRIEAAEKRADAQLAKEFIIALPVELAREQNIALMRQFVFEQVLARGQVADWVYHDEPGNPHVHLMTSLRPLAEGGFGPKKVAVIGTDGQPVRTAAGKIQYRLWAGEKAEFLQQRATWLDLQNQHLALAGLEIRVDGRSYAERGIDIVPTSHIGVATKAMQRKGGEAGRAIDLERLALHEAKRGVNARRIEARPELVLEMVTNEKSVFDARDVAKVIHRYIDDVDAFQRLLLRVLSSPETLRLDVERVDISTGARVPQKLTTREMVRTESETVNRARYLARASSHGVREKALVAVFARHDRLSDEQQAAIEHVAGGARIAAVVGRAGAGKTTMMKAAREAWETAGYRVIGGALAGKAAEGLEKEAGIRSRTLASWELRWKEAKDLPDDKTVFVLDEAGMVASKQMAGFVEAVTKAGAKLVLVGDPEQLQPIEAGAAFRAIVERIGYAELETIYRQKETWMRAASLDLARGRIEQAISAYAGQGRVIGTNLKAEAITSLIEDWDRSYDPEKSTLILAHLRRDVRDLNERAREALVKRGVVETGHAFRTEDGARNFAAGDQIVFLKNDNTLGVKNGMLGKVVEAAPGRIVAELGQGDARRRIQIEQRSYRNLDHGYATTIHKSQGATVDRVKLLASLSLDRHLTYVAMTRHRHDVALYYGKRSFAMAGGLTKVLSRRDAKETTLDYSGGRFYRQALSFANSRGLHLVHLARTLVRDQLDRTLGQKTRLVELAAKLRTMGARLGLFDRPVFTPSQSARKAQPMVKGVTSFALTVVDAAEAKLQSDKALSKQWDLVSDRIRRIYAEPEAAFRAMRLEAAFTDPAARSDRLMQIEQAPATYGALRGRSGILSSSADRNHRRIAETNVPAMRRDFERYFVMRNQAMKRLVAEETGLRQRAAIDIPALSAAAETMLAKVRDAIDRNDLPAALGFALADRMVKAEIDALNGAVRQRFGERALLGNGAGDTGGPAFKSASAGLAPAEQQKLASAWPAMRTAQQLAAHERTVTALKETEALRQTQRQGQVLK